MHPGDREHDVVPTCPLAFSLHVFAVIVALIVGRPGGTRTPNPRIWSPLLYQLSYCPIRPTQLTSACVLLLRLLVRLVLAARGQYLENSSLSGVVRLFLLVL